MFSSGFSPWPNSVVGYMCDQCIESSTPWINKAQRRTIVLNAIILFKSLPNKPHVPAKKAVVDPMITITNKASGLYSNIGELLNNWIEQQYIITIFFLLIV